MWEISRYPICMADSECAERVERYVSVERIDHRTERPAYCLIERRFYPNGSERYFEWQTGGPWLPWKGTEVAELFLEHDFELYQIYEGDNHD